MKYTFKQFGSLEIEPDNIDVNLDSLVIYPKSSTFDVEVLLTTENTKYSHTFKRLNYVGQFTDNEAIEVALNELIKFEI